MKTAQLYLKRNLNAPCKNAREIYCARKPQNFSTSARKLGKLKGVRPTCDHNAMTNAGKKSQTSVFGGHVFAIEILSAAGPIWHNLVT